MIRENRLSDLMAMKNGCVPRGLVQAFLDLWAETPGRSDADVRALADEINVTYNAVRQEPQNTASSPGRRNAKDAEIGHLKDELISVQHQLVEAQKNEQHFRSLTFVLILALNQLQQQLTPERVELLGRADAAVAAQEAQIAGEQLMRAQTQLTETENRLSEATALARELQHQYGYLLAKLTNLGSPTAPSTAADSSPAVTALPGWSSGSLEEHEHVLDRIDQELQKGTQRLEQARRDVARNTAAATDEPAMADNEVHHPEMEFPDNTAIWGFGTTGAENPHPNDPAVQQPYSVPQQNPLLPYLRAATKSLRQHRVAANMDAEAVERLITDLYTKIAEQLGSDKAPVRLAGIHALERLAQDHPAHRQATVNMLCAYLRMPYTLPDEPSDDGADDKLNITLWERMQERKVRLTAQNILTRHLRPSDHLDNTAATFWPDIDIDLTGATLINLDFTRCSIRDARFTHATFIGTAGFIQATFTGMAVFDHVAFTKYAEFSQVTFASDAWFLQTIFAGGAGFYQTMFIGNAVFGEATFMDGALFSGATFTSAAKFDGAILPSAQYVDSDTRLPWTDFTDVRFAQGVPPEVKQFMSPPDEETSQSVPT